MKNNQTIAMLVGILFITTATSAWLSLRYTSRLGAKQRLEAQMLAIQNGEGAINALANDVVEYSKKNPQINPILKEFGLLPGSSQPAATKPATR
jgi:hypothetical protein